MSESIEPKNLTSLTPASQKSKVAPTISQEMHNAMERDREMVRGKFVFHEVPRGEMGFAFRKYKGDPIETYKMKDGQIYTVPLAVARHLNTNVSYPSYTYRDNEHGKPTMTVSEKIRRCSFQSLEFFDVDSSQIKPALPTA